FDQGFFHGHVIAQSSIGFADFIDPPGEPIQGDRLVINPPLQKVWVTKDLHLIANDAQSSVGLTKVEQQFCQGQDATPPVFTKCPSDTDLGCNPASLPGCDLTPANVTATDNCGTPTLNCNTFVGPVIGCVHYQTNVYTATDLCGNSAICRQVLHWTVDA